MAQSLAQRSVDLTPDPSLMEKIGSVGFTPHEAISEFIDNSIDGAYGRDFKPIVQLPVTVKVAFQTDGLVIEDNAGGISDFDNCMKLAFTEKRGIQTLGLFGLGMKTASFSLGRKVTIESKTANERVLRRLTLDLDEWKKRGEWKLEIEDVEDNSEDHGTKIAIEKLYVDPSLYKKGLYNDLADRFGEIVANGELRILVEGVEIKSQRIESLKPEDPQFKAAITSLGLSDFKIKKDFSFTVRGMKVTGWVSLLSERSLTGRFGFNMYRGRRLIVPFMKLGVREHPTNANIFGHIYLPQEFPVNFTKNKLETNRSMFLDLKEKVEEQTVEHRRVAAKMSEQHVPIVSKKTIDNLQRSLDALKGAVAESNIVKALNPVFPIERLREKGDGTGRYGETPAERRSAPRNQHKDRPVPKDLRIRQPGKKRQVKNFWFIDVHGSKLKLICDFLDADGHSEMYFHEFNETRYPPEFLVTINTKFPAWGTTKDEAFYATGSIIMALSELIWNRSEKRSHTTIEVQQDIWNNWGRRIREWLLRNN